ncbi:MAG: dienelactone hydrolase [Dehalococcoidia bacterium]|nr:dienelactone hydrolase [Dehalococcoidia bacterium]
MLNVAVLAPGYGGGPDQRILKAMAVRLSALGILSQGVAFSTQGRRPSRGYLSEMGDVRGVRDALLAQAGGINLSYGAASEIRLGLVGRSFGGRICTFLAAEEPPDALAVLGYPIAPPGRPRPGDEAALLSLRCPTLIVQGDRDELGPMEALTGIAAQNPHIKVHSIPGVGHSFGKQEKAAIEAVALWLGEVLG